MPRLSAATVFLCLTPSALLPAQENYPITAPPMAGNSRPAGWHMDSGRGSLTVAIPIGTVPGEIPIPVDYTMNGTFMAHCSWFFFNPSVLVSAWQDFGIHGTLGFGYIGWG